MPPPCGRPPRPSPGRAAPVDDDLAAPLVVVPETVDVAGRPAVEVRVVGEVDLRTTGELERALDEVLADPGRDGGRVVVDLRGVRFLSAAGHAVLVRVRDRADVAGIDYVVLGNATVRRSLTLTGLEAMLADGPPEEIHRRSVTVRP